MAGNSISKSTEEGKPSITEDMLEQLDVFYVDISLWKRVDKITYAFYIPYVLLISIISPDDSEYFVYSSFISMLLDPLFLYIPLIKEDSKCLILDKKLMIASLILRLVTDLRYVVKIGYTINKWWQGSTDEKICITTNVVAILPIPQVRSIIKPFWST